jgi:translation initiation factor 2 subunit 2
MDYEELLKKAMENMPKKEGTGERFEMPRVDSIVQGTQTIIKNFSAIAGALRREPKHVLKFLTKELAAPGSVDGQRAMLQSKLPQRIIQAKLELYVKEYVICKECTRPDTKLVKDGRISLIKCEACGAKSPVKAI